MVLASILQVVAMFLLVGITAYYAYETRKMAQAMKRQQVAGQMPILVSLLPGFVSNIGTGIALDVSVEVRGVTRNQHPFLVPQSFVESIRFGDSMLRMEKNVRARTLESNATVKLTYKDVHGNKYETEFDTDGGGTPRVESTRFRLCM